MRSTESLGDVVVIHPLDPEDGSSIIPMRTAGRTQKACAGGSTHESSSTL
jgi:hypothetical protein